jgi:transcriptional regulator with XRE-family HTH domain
MNGPGRADLADAVLGHRNARRWSQKGTALRGGMSPGTVKNVENKRSDLLPGTLVGLDNAFQWPAGTAEEILVHRAAAPALPSRQAVSSGVPRRLLAEIDGREVYEVRAFPMDDKGTRLVVTVVGDDDADLGAVRDALVQIDDLERMLHRRP